MIELLSIPEVRVLGDSLDRIEIYIRDRYQVRAGAALEELFHRFPREALENSALRALEEFGRLKNFLEDVLRVKQSYAEMERRALEIIQELDTLWYGGSGIVTRGAMGTILEDTNDPTGRFLTVFRYNNTTVERAHRLLGFYYYASGRHIQAAEHLMFAFLIQNTIMYDFVFTNLDALMDEVMRRQILID